MFRISSEKWGNFTKIKLRNEESNEYVSIIPEFGANVNEIVLGFRKGLAKKLYRVIDGDSTPEELSKNEWFRGAKLSPFPNRIRDGIYICNKVNYEIPINFPSQHHAIHGLVYNKKFKILKKIESKTKASVILRYKTRGLRGYPFSFELIMEYKLDSKGFSCKTTMTNLDVKEIPYGDGWHPYFVLGHNADELFLKIPSGIKLKVDNRMIPTGKARFTKFIKTRKISGEKFDTGFIVDKSREKIAHIEIRNDKEDATLYIWQETGKNKYNYFQIFIPPSRKSIAVEPMTCSSDAFNNKEGLIILKPEQKFTASYGVQLQGNMRLEEDRKKKKKGSNIRRKNL